MIISLYFIAIGGLFYKLFIQPPKTAENRVNFPLIPSQPALNKKAAKSNV